MVQNGVWRATKPEVTDHAGFRLNALVSLLANASWPKLAQEFIRAKSDPAELQVFSNTVLAEGWSIPSQIDQTAVSARAEPISLENIPVEVIALTCGIDVQDDRCEASIVGWTRDHVAIVLAHFVIWGSYQDQSLWDEVDELLRTKWRHKWGGLLKVDATAIDCSDGDHADHIINFAVPRTARRVFATKGMAGPRPAFQMTKSKSAAGKFAIVGVDGVKNTVFDRLQRARGLRFSNTLEPVYLSNFAASKSLFDIVAACRCGAMSESARLAPKVWTLCATPSRPSRQCRSCLIVERLSCVAVAAEAGAVAAGALNTVSPYPQTLGI